ncbi:UDP-N-acetyl-D-glucosamine dehydrogenase [Enterococcus sp. DIV0212c]|uniref:nucleotide sugar dehydrogenase n=1 Tax=Enterococcus sp. DIV0212c TaxID=2230867 RepID=UPI001F616832|nr:nucleotide sugar dehydrogenase [Enterococcus sp. DIV0212c]
MAMKMEKCVVVIGLGYVGLPSVINHMERGHKVVGFDIDEKKINLLNQGVSYIDTVEDKTIEKLLENGVLFTSDEQMIEGKDVYIIDVPTPIDKNKVPNLDYIKAAVDLIKEKVKNGSLIVLESTTYPGTTEEYLVEVFSKLGYQVGSDLYIAYSPERIDPGNEKSFSAKIPRIVGGYSDNCLTKACDFFGSHVYPASNLKTAELAKIYENTFRLVNIALADELQKISDNLSIEVKEVLKAADTKPFGFMKFTPNLGIGGHCIPVDPYYLTWLMESRGIETPLIQAAGEINDSMLDYYLNKIIAYAEKKSDKSLDEMNIAILGITYKKNVADTRMSSVISLIKKLEDLNMNVISFDDVIVSNVTLTENSVMSLEGDYCQLKDFDLVIYAVGHNIYEKNKKELVQNSQLFYDLTLV